MNEKNLNVSCVFGIDIVNLRAESFLQLNSTTEANQRASNEEMEGAQ